jgi:hypothetical protein
MANYNVSTYQVRGTMVEVLAGLEATIEAIDTSKTLRAINIVPEGKQFRGYLIYDA